MPLDQTGVNQGIAVYKSYRAAIFAFGDKFFTADAIQEAMNHVPSIETLVKKQLNDSEAMQRMLEMQLLAYSQLRKLRQYTEQLELSLRLVSLQQALSMRGSTQF